MSTRRSRWQIRIAATAGLVWLPACAMLPTSPTQPDHVFSARAPAELDRQFDPQPPRTRAQYPDEVSFNMLDLGSPPAENADSFPQDSEQFRQGRAGASQFAALTDTFPPARPAVWNAAENPNPIHLTSFAGSGPGRTVSPVSFTPAEPRQPASNDPRIFAQLETVATGPMPDAFPDEYVFDGGDRGAPVHYSTGIRNGIETEDTIVEFADHTGQQRVKPSNRVAVYSPRFGSVRTVDGLETDIKVDGAAGARDTIAVSNLNVGQNAAAHLHGTGIVGLESSRRADGVETSLPASASAGASRVSQNRKVDHGHEGRRYTSANAFEMADAAVISQHMHNAVAWTRNQFPQIMANTAASNQVIATFKVQQTVGVEDNRRTKGDIRIIKLADRGAAQTGDVVLFTIQFENPGDFDVYDVQIVDNLTPRLQYVPESGSIDDANPGSLTVRPNGEGSHILTFQLDGPLKGHSRGFITFEARVL